MTRNTELYCLDCQRTASTECVAKHRMIAPDAEGEWCVHNRRDVVTSDDRYVAFATSDKHAAQIVSDHKAAKSQALLVEALQDLLACSRCQNGCAPDDMTCATNKADAALKAAGVEK